MREGLDETLTLQRLGIEGRLYVKLRTTNSIENLGSGREIPHSLVHRLIYALGGFFRARSLRQTLENG